MEAGNENFRVVGCIPYCANQSGFALPIFCGDKSKNTSFIQYIDEISGKIRSFKSVKIDKSNLLPLNSQILTSCGEYPIFIFIENSKKISIGPLVEIKNNLIAYETSNPKEIAVILQIRELIGSQEEKRILRKRFRNFVYDLGDISSANIFIEDSVLKIELWNLLIEYSPSMEVSQSVMRYRSFINVEVKENNLVIIDNNFLTNLGYSEVLLQKISRILQIEFESTFKLEFDNNQPTTNENASNHDAYENVIKAITRSSRQEERVAIILRILLEDFDLGKKVLSVYNSDRGKFASSAIRKMSSLMIDNRPNNLSNDRLAETIFEQLYKECFPMNQGAFLYLFARHFSQHNCISDSIARKVSKGTNRYVQEWKNRIYQELDQVSPKIYSDRHFYQTDIFDSKNLR